MKPKSREEKNRIIKKVFDSLAGKKINQGSFVIRWGSGEIYQVTRKDSKIAECKKSLNLFQNIKEEKTEVFFKIELCRYDLFIKRINLIFGELKNGN